MIRDVIPALNLQHIPRKPSGAWRSPDIAVRVPGSCAAAVAVADDTLRIADEEFPLMALTLRTLANPAAPKT